MRKIVITQNLTADGVMDMSGGWFDPAAQGVDQSDLVEVNRVHQDAADVLLVGRGTFESFRDFWPHLRDDTTGVADYLQRVQKHVVSSTLTEPGWTNTTVVRGPAADHVRALRSGEGGDVVITGSPRLAQEALREGLVDELRLFVFPVAVGTGQRLFPEGTAIRLEPLESRGFAVGCTLLRYRVRP
ncbi:dihydrofolate reductase family protein [Pseudonocardia humida]|uniref:Dihydrofolate reductase family protein n=1 Tax=Pseudonocardia humida TaxID=2800819 RepID=A0ABT0ZSH6_9PSEU|nr:dihydrofolate reductase family protein [Pseudonocardia humida]MCO1653663.1 dihydrofolate reductase family protein [Pseudonocardia humida]